MQTGWLSKAGPVVVEHVPCPHPNVRVDMTNPARGVQHTTEGRTVESALSVFLKRDAPHFVVGRSASGKVRIVQCIPLGMIAAALEHHGDPPTNGLARAQVELVGFAQHAPWRPDLEVLLALGALYGALAQAQGIPLHHEPNPKRDPKVWLSRGGWYGHDGIPNQWQGHWDPGNLDYGAVFAYAQAIVPPKVTPKPKPVVLHPTTWRLRRRANGLVYGEPLDRPH